MSIESCSSATEVIRVSVSVSKAGEAAKAICTFSRCMEPNGERYRDRPELIISIAISYPLTWPHGARMLRSPRSTNMVSRCNV